MSKTACKFCTWEQPDLALFYSCRSQWEILHTFIHLKKISSQLIFLLFFNSTAYKRGKIPYTGCWYKSRIGTCRKVFCCLICSRKASKKDNIENHNILKTDDNEWKKRWHLRREINVFLLWSSSHKSHKPYKPSFIGSSLYKCLHQYFWDFLVLIRPC